MRDLVIRSYAWLASRPKRDDRGQTAEYLMWGVVATVGVLALGSRLFDDVLNGLIDRIQGALP